MIHMISFLTRKDIEKTIFYRSGSLGFNVSGNTFSKKRKRSKEMIIPLALERMTEQKLIKNLMLNMNITEEEARERLGIS